ncbi:response regulator [Amycolatopsis balhimycina]|uniref:response regulator n=1 Tax=Amycolatopsis balhimycina TaxID=208443 RepID=UPI0005C1E0B9|nr:response regulator transcription factor [Amycolatopsis balhimycina]
MIRVALVDDQALVREGLRGLLQNGDDILVVAEASNGLDAVRMVKSVKPDVVLMDVRMPQMDGLEATAQISADPELAGCRVVVLTTFEMDEYVFRSLRAGASGFLSKDIDPEELRRAVRVVAAGDSLLSPSVTRRLISHFVATGSPGPTRPERLAVLTDREREVMAQVAGGLSNAEIGRRLSISPETARTHVHRAMTKLNARDRAELVVVAYETGLVRVGHV